MSAIWGVWRRDGNPCPATGLRQMAEQMPGLGPDGLGEWTEGSLGLARALAMTLPEDSFDCQPLPLGGGSVMVADVRLDNRTDLAGALGIDAVQQRDMADSQVLGAAWERWREDCLNRLVGAFAFAVWDAPRRRLFCARDHLGRRPFYYSVQGPLFAFASLPRGLHGLPEIPWVVDETTMAIRLAFLPNTGQRTYFEKIHKLPPAHCMSLGLDWETVRQYWKLDPERRIQLPRDDDYCEAFLEVFDEAVRCRLRARGPVGTMLSGGFDSGSVTATAARLLAREGRSLTAFTAVPAPEFHGTIPADRFGNEAEHAASVAALYPNLRHVLVPPAPVCPLDLIVNPPYWNDSPGSHFSMLPNAFAMGEAQRRAGLRVVLTGLKGNMTISYKGWSLMNQLVRQGRWRQWYAEAHGLIAHAHFGWPGVLALSVGPWTPRWLWRALHSEGSEPFIRVRKYVLLHPNYFRSGELFRLAGEREWDLSYRPQSNGPRGRMANLLRVDQGAFVALGQAKSGINFRDPTIDRRLVEFCMALPEEQYLRAGQTRYILRRAMAGRLSPRVLEEWRKGLCGADWHLRVAPYQARFAGAVEQIAEVPAARRCLDIDRMRRLAARWPQDWSVQGVQFEHGMGLCRAVQVGLFMRWVAEAG